MTVNRAANSGRAVHRVTFAKRGTASDGYGGVLTAPQDEFTSHATFIHLRGGEHVFANRLQGTHTQIIRVRSHVKSREVTSDWIAKNTRTGEVFNIRDVTHDESRRYVDFLCEKGVAV